MTAILLGAEPLRRRVGRPLRQFLRELQWSPQFRRLQQSRGIGEGRRAFLLGNGPSLGELDLSRLAGEFVCVVNMGIRALGQGLPHADMHVVTDPNRYRRFAQEIEAAAREHAIPHRFVIRRGRPVWQRLPERANEPVWLTMHTAKLTEARGIPPVSEGVVSGPSVLISAAVLLEFLGFSPMYVIGCDLDYEGSGKYFYPLGALDQTHEADATVIGRRPAIAGVGEHLAILHESFQRRGHGLVNAGQGGNLASLPRVSFSELFPSVSATSQAG